MKKPDALLLVNKKYGLKLDNRNTHFSTENSAKPVFWYEIPLSKIEDATLQNIFLIAERAGEVNLLKVPTRFFRDNLDGFKIRTEKQLLCLELDVVTYLNKVGYDKKGFKQFVL